MFRQIFKFETQNWVRRPAAYLYFTGLLLFTILSFATGSLPRGEKEHFNAPFVLAFWSAATSMMMMLVSSSIMGMPLYRDIEYNTKDYYLTYPITKAGYFWGRYLSSLLCMVIICSSVFIGAFIGTKVGPVFGWRDASNYGPNNFIYYLHPFLTIALPNLFFTSSLFFGLVAIMRNVKVIYSGGILLFLGYFLATFFIQHTNNATVINIADPFGFNGIRLQSNVLTDQVKNVSLITISGDFLTNRLLWPGIGLVILIYTYLRFNFETFFAGKRDKIASIDEPKTGKRGTLPKIATSFVGTYNRVTLLNLAKIELTNIIRDNYFWIIILAGSGFLGFVLYLGDNNYGVPNFPSTVELLTIFNDIFLFFIFFVIIFYTGETVHRDRLTRFAFINDALPPPNWVLNGSRLVSLVALGFFLALMPIPIGVIVQLIRGYTHFQFDVYLMDVALIILPRFIEMVLFAYMLHVVINNKFVAHGIGITFWVVGAMAYHTGLFNYNMLLYANTPGARVSDMDGIGHMATPICWFNLYWLLCGGLLVIIAALFYYRGITSSFKERLQLVAERFDTKTRAFTAVLLFCFLAVAGYVYYNVSYLNNYITMSENTQRAVLYERQLKKYAHLPLPQITAIKLNADLFPDEQMEKVNAFVTVVNNNNKPISQILLDGDNLTEYTLKIGGKALQFSTPLLYPRGKFNWFRPKQDTADFRLYQFAKPLAPGDTAVIEVNSSVSHKGFENDLYARNQLRNAIFFTGGLPGLGYDDDDELSSPYERKENNLPPKREDEIPQDDPIGMNQLKTSPGQSLFTMDITVSTSGDQVAIAPGELQKKWQQGGRNYYHYVQNKPGMYAPFGILSSRYAVARGTAPIGSGKTADVEVYYTPQHKANVNRFMAGYSEALTYYSKAFGAYPFGAMRVVENSIYGPGSSSITSMDTYAENNGWAADFTSPGQFDFIYFSAAEQVAHQWWRYQASPNNTVGGMAIAEGVSKYSALMMAEKKYGKDNMRGVLLDRMWGYLFFHDRDEGPEHPVIRANRWFTYNKTGTVLYGLRDMIGEDTLNAALREFKDAWAFRNKPPYAGSKDLYRYLQKHTPDSLKYYLVDTWEKITFYDNKVLQAKAQQIGKTGSYKVTMKVSTEKSYTDDKGHEKPAPQMNDHINIAVFAADGKDKDGRSIKTVLYSQKHKLTAGAHTITLIVKGKPASVGIDPNGILIDRMPGDNLKEL